MDRTGATSIDEYIAGFPAETQAILERVRATIRDAAPEADETKLITPFPRLLSRGTWCILRDSKTISVSTRAPSGIEKFKAELAGYESAKGSVKFPLDQPVPYDLIREIVKFRVAENLQKAEAKKKKKAG